MNDLLRKRYFGRLLRSISLKRTTIGLSRSKYPAQNIASSLRPSFSDRLLVNRLQAVLIAVLVLFSTSVVSQESVFSEAGPSDPAKAKIFKELASELRCLVCQNQNIADSNAPLAQDLRREIHEMLDRGESKSQILDFMVQRYGEFILYRPLFSAKTLLLWLGPLIFFLIGLFLVWRMVRSPATPAFEPDDASLAQARELLSAGQSKDQSP